MQYPAVYIRPGKEHILSHKHPWIFSQALLPLPKEIPSGSLCDVYSSDKQKIFARGYLNHTSQIAVRILTRDQKEEINQEFFENRLRELMAIRERFIDTKQTNAFRVVFGESDNMPGLIIDKYADVYVLQIHTLGMNLLKPVIVEAMASVLKPKTIFERSDVGVRKLEGLSDMPVGILFGEPIKGEIEILENGISMGVNVIEGQKTGMFLDQRENRKALQKYVTGKRVLNCFCYTAGFSLYAALAGAKETVNIDVSAQALETAKRNFERNHLNPTKHQFLDKDVFNALEDFAKQKEKFDVIILDPPAFVKNQKSLKKGLSGYLFINERALGLLPKGGILVSSSCSAHVTDEMFAKTLSMAAAKANCSLKAIEIRHQPIDHPFNVNFPEGKYLKYYVMLKE